MSLRLLEIVISDRQHDAIADFLEKNQFLGTWCGPLEQQRLLVRILLYAKEAEEVIDQLDEAFSELQDFNLMLLEVEAALPRPDLLGPQDSRSLPSWRKGEQPQSRVNREELYTDIIEGISISWRQNIMVILSTLIAAVGLLQNSQAAIIGAMVIAPLLKPNMALAVATTLGDLSLGVKTLRTGLLGIGLAIALSAAIGYAFPVDPSLSEISMRTDVQLTDVILALASGAAGSLALTMGEAIAVVGVMVSVALLPPLVVFGLLIGSGQWQWLLGSGLLVLTNLVCLNLAAVIVMWVQDIEPRQENQADKAEKATGVAFAGWALLLAGLVTAITLWKYQVP
ncbi:MAG: TIGR00341 family protein [Elainellaceae cyanobacterium]